MTKNDESRKAGVIVCGKCTQLRVAIPEEWIWTFLSEFGEAFEARDDGSREAPARKPLLSGWYVIVTVPKDEEADLYTFLRLFCKNKGLIKFKPK